MSESDFHRDQVATQPGRYGPPPGYRTPSINEQQTLGRAGSSGNRTLIAVAVVVVVAVVAVAGWRLLTPSSGSPSVPMTTIGPVANPSAQASASGTILETVALQQTDLQNGYGLRLVGAGDQVAGQVTLDNCGYRFTTEAHRVARRQFYVTDPAGRDTGVGNEVVAYDTAGNAELALRQWHRAALTCPHHPVTSAIAGGPRVTERITRDEVGSAALPVRENIVTVESASAPGIGKMYMIAVLQVRGTVLDAIYASQHRRPTPADIRGALLIATATGEHLAHLS